MINNKKGFILYGFLVILFLINFTAGGIMNEFLKSIKDEKLHLNKEETRILAESGLELAMNKIGINKTSGSYFIQEGLGQISIEIEKIEEELYFVESIGLYESSKTKVEGKIGLKDGLHPIIIERKMW